MDKNKARKKQLRDHKIKLKRKQAAKELKFYTQQIKKGKLTPEDVIYSNRKFVPKAMKKAFKITKGIDISKVFRKVKHRGLSVEDIAKTAEKLEQQNSDNQKLADGDNQKLAQKTESPKKVEKVLDKQ